MTKMDMPIKDHEHNIAERLEAHVRPEEQRWQALVKSMEQQNKCDDLEAQVRRTSKKYDDMGNTLSSKMAGCAKLQVPVVIGGFHQYTHSELLVKATWVFLCRMRAINELMQLPWEEVQGPPGPIS